MFNPILSEVVEYFLLVRRRGLAMEKSVKITIDPNRGQDQSEKKAASSSRGGWSAAIFVICVEVAEQFAYIGLSSNLIMYLTTVLHEPTATAAKHVNTWVGVSATFPLLGAFVADSFLGRFRTIILSSTVYFLGMVVLTLSASSVVSAENRKAVFFTALYILSVGEGGHKPCVQTFAADQFDEDSPEDRVAKGSFFNWWYLGLVIGSTLAVFLVIYLQDNISWTLGFGVLAVVLGLAISLFLLGVRRYKTQAPLGSPITTVAQVVVAAARKWRVDETSPDSRVYFGDDHDLAGQPCPSTLTRTNQLRVLEKAMIIDRVDDDGSKENCRNPWRLCTLTQVEEVKLVFRLIPVWLSCLMFAVVQTQLHTYFTKQASTMKRSVGHGSKPFTFPPASLQGIVGFTILAAVPIYDKFFVPMARKITGNPTGITTLQRIGVGLFLSILNMAVSALVEAKRVSVSKQHNLIDSPKAIVPMSVWWLLPQYMICGVSDAFTIVGLQELFYEQMPESMRSFGAAAYVSIIGIGSFVSTAIIMIVQAVTSGGSVGNRREWLVDNLNRAHLDYFYCLLAGLSALNLLVFVWVAKRFVYKSVGNKLDLTNNLNGRGNGRNRVTNAL